MSGINNIIKLDIEEHKIAHNVILITSQTAKINNDELLKFAHEVIYMSDDGPNLYEKERENILTQMRSVARAHSNTLFLISAGPVAKIMVYEMWQASKCNQYIDVGSALGII
jgi:hypothetical protein